MRLALTAAAVLLSAAPLAGCLSAPQPARYRFLDPVAPGPGPGGGGPALRAARLVDVGAGAAAREVLTWRGGDGTVTRLETERWAEAPADFVRRLALVRLATRGGTAAAANRLSLEVLAFGGRDSGDRREAEVRLFAVVEDEGGRLLAARELAATRPLADGTSRAELCVALGELAAELVDAAIGLAVDAPQAR